ncbi:Preprotein translocase subunit YajC (TC 3.A.5.1.1) [Olavius algarvensis spirochete endosymbiont]|uniref:preprotein translocase subunit YajC n=1 Tax=Olavius algarvensis spirochete endosymbiont TaxID=260710 RepID=UPI000F1211CD|nr:preprotein translocase subunit YajC [Olavius algarvensis spirochete endosymbiont]CAD7841451.1 MAG: Protein translocase subunit YajC [Olavius algarvensis spirochete endosymbiont]VDA99602.1 Preprotein translocase subunit YajC (TC 3.A.5.1.1) [Olavius algarvensis spirochete endosymbiont]
MLSNLTFLSGVQTPGGAEGGSGGYVQVLIIVGIFAIFYFLIIRPQRRKQKETKRMIEGVRKGDKITTIGGIRGVVKNVMEKSIIIEVDNKGTTLEFMKTAIGSVDAMTPEKPFNNGGK